MGSVARTRARGGERAAHLSRSAKSAARELSDGGCGRSSDRRDAPRRAAAASDRRGAPSAICEGVGVHCEWAGWEAGRRGGRCVRGLGAAAHLRIANKKSSAAASPPGSRTPLPPVQIGGRIHIMGLSHGSVGVARYIVGEW